MFCTEFNFFFLIVFINIFIFWFEIITKIKHAGDLSSYIRAHAELTIGLGRFWGLGSARGRRFDPEFLWWTQQKTDYAYGAHARNGPNPYFLEFFFEIFFWNFEIFFLKFWKIFFEILKFFTPFGNDIVFRYSYTFSVLFWYIFYGLQPVKSEITSEIRRSRGPSFQRVSARSSSRQKNGSICQRKTDWNRYVEFFDASCVTKVIFSWCYELGLNFSRPFSHIMTSIPQVALGWDWYFLKSYHFNYVHNRATSGIFQLRKIKNHFSVEKYCQYFVGL